MTKTGTLLWLEQLLERDINRLIEEIGLYPDDGSLWKVLPGTTNTGGNLALHLAGNIHLFIGKLIGKADYTRDRESEFSMNGLTKEQVVEKVVAAKEAALAGLKNMLETDLEELYPIEVFKKPMKSGYFLIHLNGHLNYHLGQINYHRRVVSAM